MQIQAMMQVQAHQQAPAEMQIQAHLQAPVEMLIQAVQLALPDQETLIQATLIQATLILATIQPEQAVMQLVQNAKTQHQEMMRRLQEIQQVTATETTSEI